MIICAWPSGRSDRSNPYLSSLYDGLVALEPSWSVVEPSIRNAGRCDIIHVHWPEDFATRSSWLRAFARSAVTLLVLLYARLNSASVVWTVHNVMPHEDRYRKLQKFHYCALSRLVNGLIFLSSASHDKFSAAHGTIFERSIFCHIPHGVYEESVRMYPPDFSLKAFSKPVRLISFGQIRRYKNISGICDLVNLANGAVSLRVAGEVVDRAEAEKIVSRASDSVQIGFGWMSEFELATFIDAADAVVIADMGVVNSGAIFLALSRGIRVIAPTTDSMKELREVAGSDWVFLYDRLDLAALQAAVDWGSSRPEGVANLSPFSWSSVAERHVEFFRTVS